MAKLVPADLQTMKQSGERIVALIVYDYQMAPDRRQGRRRCADRRR